MKGDKTNSTTKSFISLFGTTSASKALAFVYQATIAAKIGANIVTDSYITATEFYTFINATVFDALIIVLLGRYIAIQTSDGEKAAMKMVSNVISICIPVMLILSVGLVVCSDYVVIILTPGFTMEQREMVARCIRQLAVTPVIFSIAVSYEVILRQHKHYVVLSLQSFFISSIGIVCVLFFSGGNDNADAITIGYVISIITYCLFLFLGVRRYGTVNLQRPIINNDLKIISHDVIPLIISSGITKTALMIDKVLASTQGIGAISCLAYCQMLYYFIVTIFIKNMCTVLLTDFVKLCTEKKLEHMKEKIRRAVSMLTYVMIPITILTIIFAKEITTIVFARGNFSGENVETTAELLAIYAISFIPAIIQNIYTQVHYAFGENKVAMRNGLISIGINIGTSVGLSLIIGLNGIAIGTVISTIVSAAYLKKTLVRHLPGYRLFGDKKALVRLGVGTASCLIVSIAVKLSFTASELAVFSVATVLSFAVFFLILLLLKEPLIKVYLPK